MEVFLKFIVFDFYKIKKYEPVYGPIIDVFASQVSMTGNAWVKTLTW